ncbi:NAD(P)H-dependent oxidoreductase [Candidatus Parcubacteria bacterium]|nr:NAD(P)H-dependent oxidoreductase [Candidatus Parcubacteria bacterium]
MVNIKVIAGSTRPGRFNIQVANWVVEQAKKHKESANVELLDLAEINLPFLDEPIPPSKGKYQNEHTKKWASIIGGADGFVFVTPEYNHSVSAALKNALDFLFAEWNYKPVTIVSYGSLAGGARVTEHLRGIAGELYMFDIREQMLIPNYWDNRDEKGEYQFSDRQESKLEKQLSSLIFWAKHMKTARQEL